MRLSSQFVWGHSCSVLNSLRGEVPCDSTNLHNLIAENLDKPKVDAKQRLLVQSVGAQPSFAGLMPLLASPLFLVLYV
jgi:hypothetical protein